MSQIRKSLAGEEDLAFDLNRNNETYDILDSNGQLSIRHKINAKSIPVTADIAYGTNENVYDYLKDLVALLNAFDLFQDTNATQLNFNKSKVDYVTINSSLALLTKPPVGEVAVFVVGGSVQVNPEDFTVEGSIITFVEGLFLDGTKVACLYSINDYTYPALPGGDTDERIEQLEAEQAIQAIAIDARSKWIFPPKSQGSPWQKNEWTRDSDWTMIANKDTFDRPAPQANGDVISSTPVEPVLTTDNNTGFVQSGQVYEFTEAGILNKVEIYVPAIGPDITYRVILADVTDPENPVVSIIDNPILVANEWNIIAIGSFLVSTGSIFQVRIDTLNSGSNTTVTGGWKYAGTNNNGTPTTSEWNRNSQQDILRINKTDLDLINRSAELNGIIAGSTVLMSQTSIPSRYNEYIVNSIIDGTDYVEYGVTLVESGGGGPEIDQPTTMTATIPIPSVTEYSEEINYYASNSPSFANVIGTLILSGTPQGGIANNLFGVQIEFQPYTFSPDWDTVAVANVAGGGSGGGGGGGDSLPLTGGTMSGNIDMATYNLDRVGLMVMGENQDISRSIDLRCSIDPLQSQYSARLIRNAGSNADFVIENVGAGDIVLDGEANVSLAGSRAIELADAVNPQDAVTKAQLDASNFNEYLDGFQSSDHKLGANNIDANTIEINSDYYMYEPNGASNLPTADTGYIVKTRVHTVVRFQEAQSVFGSVQKRYFRIYSTSAWTSWNEIALADDFIPLAGNESNPMIGDFHMVAGSQAFMGRIMEIGGNSPQTDQTTFIDLHSSADPSQLDYSARIIRNSGVNGSFSFTNLGTGSTNITSGGGISLTSTSNITLNPTTEIINCSNSRLTNVLLPTVASDGATKGYVDNASGNKWWGHVTNGSSSTPTVTGGGISSITKATNGRYTINLSSSVSSNTAIIIDVVMITTGSVNREIVYNRTISTTTKIEVNIVDSSGDSNSTDEWIFSIRDMG